MYERIYYARFFRHKKYDLKGCSFLIAINEREKKAIAERLPGVHIRRTVKRKSKRHQYYMEEDREAMRILRSLRKPA